jgi:hypothetical protein
MANYKEVVALVCNAIKAETFVASRRRAGRAVVLLWPQERGWHVEVHRHVGGEGEPLRNDIWR